MLALVLWHASRQLRGLVGSHLQTALTHTYLAWVELLLDALVLLQILLIPAPRKEAQL